MAAAWLAGSRGFSTSNVASLSTGAFSIGGADKYLRSIVLSGAGTPVTPTSNVWDAAGVNEALTSIETPLTLNAVVRASVWAKVAPSDGTNKVATVTWPSNQDETAVITDAYNGIDQSTPARTLPTPATGTGTSPSLNVTSVSGDLVVGSVATSQDSSPTLTTVTSSTLTVHEKVEGADMGGYEQLGQGDVTASGTTTSVSFTLGTTDTAIHYALFGAALIPAAGGGGDDLMGQASL